jgi:hypothetical protein
MAKIHFRPEEYRSLNQEERELLAEGYLRAIEAVRKNVTPSGFSACSLTDNVVYGTDANYRSVWARDGAITALWTLDLEDEDIRRAQVATFETLLSKQSPTGQIPANVRIETGQPDYAGVGGIASIDSVMWIIIGSGASLRSPRRLESRRAPCRAVSSGPWTGSGPTIRTAAACSRSPRRATGPTSSDSATTSSTTRCSGIGPSTAYVRLADRLGDHGKGGGLSETCGVCQEEISQDLLADDRSGE